MCATTGVSASSGTAFHSKYYNYRGDFDALISFDFDQPVTATLGRYKHISARGTPGAGSD